MSKSLHAIVHRRRNDLELLGLVGLMLAVVAVFLSGQAGRPQGEGAGWRRIDVEAVQRLIDSGDLSAHEARWYRADRRREKKP